MLLAGLAGLALMAAEPVTAHSKVVSMPLSQRRNSNILYKRDPFAVSLQNLIPFGEYFITASVGTPGQEVELVLDTGSSDIWFFSTAACKEVGCQGGSFDMSSSSTLRNVNSEGEFEIEYETADSKVSGQYIADTLTVGGVSLDNLTMAVATQATAVYTGIMGVGLAVDESAVGHREPKYVNFPLELVSQGKIGSTCYSLYLDNLATSTGMMLFGGYDEAKFAGDLVMLPLQLDSQSQSITSFTVSFTSLGISDSNGDVALEVDDFVFPAVLDSGTTLTYMPTALYNSLFEYFEVQTVRAQGGDLNVIACDFGKKNPGALVYGLGGPNGAQILVNFDEIAVPLYDPQTGVQYSLQNGDLACQFGIGESGGGLSILFGQTFLRSAYVLYDLDNNQAGVAQTIFDVTSSNVVAYDSKAKSHDRISTVTNEPSVTYAVSATLSAPGGFSSGFLGSSIGASSAMVSGGFASSVATSYSLSNDAYPTDAVVATSVASTIAPGATGLISLSSGTTAAPTGPTIGSGTATTSSSPSSSSGSSSGKNAASSTVASPVYASVGAFVVLILTAMLIL